MNISDVVTLKDERGRSHNAKVMKIHSDKLLNLQIIHPNKSTQLYNRILKTPKIPLRFTPYWENQNKPTDTVKVVKSNSKPTDTVKVVKSNSKPNK